MKRVLAIVLSIIILFGSATISAFAEENKLSDSVRELIENSSSDRQADVIVYLSVETKSIDEMPAFPQYQSINQYAEYLREHNRALINSIFEGVDTEFINYALMGCIIAYGVSVSDIAVIAEDESVRSVDLYTTEGFDGGFQFKDNKISPALKAVLLNCDSEDYVVIDVHNAKHLKTVAEMPSWPGGGGDREEMDRQAAQARQEYRTYIEEVEREFFEQAFKDVNVVYYLTGFGFMTHVAVKAKDVEKIAMSEAVRDIECNENAFEILPETTDPELPVLGDADCDGSVTVLDATCIQKLKAGVIEEYQMDIFAADVDKDGFVSILDATRIQKYKANLCNLDGTPIP